MLPVDVDSLVIEENIPSFIHEILHTIHQSIHHLIHQVIRYDYMVVDEKTLHSPHNTTTTTTHSAQACRRTTTADEGLLRGCNPAVRVSAGKVGSSNSSSSECCWWCDSSLTHLQPPPPPPPAHSHCGREGRVASILPARAPRCLLPHVDPNPACPHALVLTRAPEPSSPSVLPTSQHVQYLSSSCLYVQIRRDFCLRFTVCT